MARSGLSQGNPGVLFKTIYDPPGQYFINFYNVAKQNPSWIVFPGPKQSTPAAPHLLRSFYRTEPDIIKVGIV